MKRGSQLFVFSFIAFLLISISLVSAERSIGEALNAGINEFTKFIKPFAKNILGDTPSGQYLFAKVLFFIIILAIVWTALGRVDFFSGNNWVLWIVSLAASILSTRWLASEALINTIILPYTTLGIAISAGLPFVLYFLLVNVGFSKSTSIVRRIAWVFFAVIFIGLWIARRDSLLTGNSYAGYIYPVTAIVAFIMAWMDGTIHRFFVKLDIEKAGKQNVDELEAELRRKINQADKDFADGIITQAERDRRIKTYRNKIAGLHR